MNIQMPGAFLVWCSVIDYGILILLALAIVRIEAERLEKVDYWKIAFVTFATIVVCLIQYITLDIVT